MEIQGRTFLIAGGGSGLGAATARMLVGAGAHVLIADLNRAAGEAIAAELGESAHFAATDVTDEASVQAAVGAAIEVFGGLHGAVNCAGIAIAERALGKSGPHPLDAFTKVIMINLVGTFNVIRLAAAAMAQNEPLAGGERGVIVNTASVAAFDGQIGQAAYSASKGGIVAMTLPIARELARFGIRVMTIAPGVFWTPMVDGMPDNVQQALAASIPFPSRLGKPEEFADLVAYILGNTYLNGETIRLDGATRLAPK